MRLGTGGRSKRTPRAAHALIALLLAAAIGPALLAQSAPSPPTGGYTPHLPIRILADADFNASNGVTAGTGTPGDPFIIAGWNIDAGLGTGIRVQNTTMSYVIRDNLIRGYTGVLIDGVASAGAIVNNDIRTRSVGIDVRSSSPLVADNAIHLDTPLSGSARGIVLFASNSRVEANFILTHGIGIDVDRGTPTITLNDIHQSSIGIDVTGTTNATIHANIITTPMHSGIYVSSTITTNVTFNLVTTSWGTGIEIWLNKDVTVDNNTVRHSTGVGVAFESSSGNFTSNVVLDGKVTAVVIWHSPLVMVNNTIENNLGVGFHFSMSAADAQANVFLHNGVGIVLDGESVVHLRANVMLNNTVGISIPYEARQSIVHLEANIVNGVNIDGTLDASQQVYFYQEANVTITGQVRDSGFSAGYSGSLTAQGGVVLYEVNTAHINATLIAHHNVGVTAINSFNVNVIGSVLVNNLVGIHAEAKTVPFQVPHCAVAVKKTNVTIDIDPVATFGITARACYTLVLDSEVSFMDTGIRLDAGATGIVANTTIHATSGTALDVSTQGAINLSANTITNSRMGLRLNGGASATVADNVIVDNTRAGIQLDSGVNVDLVRNNVSRNGEGIVDARICMGPGTCATARTEANVILDNRGDGLRLHGAATLRGDLLGGNRGNGATLGSATLTGVRAEGNEGNGLVVRGDFTLRDTVATDNRLNGLDVVGSGELRDSTFTHNRDAGIKARAIAITALGINASENLDGILFEELVPTLGTSVSIPGLLGTIPSLTTNTPLTVHLSTFLGNARDAIRVQDTPVDATHNYFGPLGPRVSYADTLGAFQNGVGPTVRFVPWFSDPGMTTTGPVPGL